MNAKVPIGIRSHPKLVFLLSCRIWSVSQLLRKLVLPVHIRQPHIAALILTCAACDPSATAAGSWRSRREHRTATSACLADTRASGKRPTPPAKPPWDPPAPPRAQASKRPPAPRRQAAP